MQCDAMVMVCYVMLCYVMLCYVLLFYAMPCYVMVCSVVLCQVLLPGFDAHGREEGEGDIEANTQQASQVASLKGAPTMRDAQKAFQDHEQLKQRFELEGSRSRRQHCTRPLLLVIRTWLATPPPLLAKR